MPACPRLLKSVVFRGEVLVVRLHLEGRGKLCPVEIQRKELREAKHRAGSGNE